MPTPTPALILDTAVHSFRSSYREMVLHHLFVGELLRTLWLKGLHAEVLRPRTDDSGYTPRATRTA